MTLQLKIISPEKILAERAAQLVTLPASEGQMGVLVGHAPMIVGLQAGTAEVTAADGTVENFAITGGFAEITADEVVILADSAGG